MLIFIKFLSPTCYIRFLEKRKEKEKKRRHMHSEEIDHNKTYLRDKIPFNEVVKAPPLITIVPKQKVIGIKYERYDYQDNLFILLIFH
jgi:hypothetical protein